LDPHGTTWALHNSRDGSIVWCNGKPIYACAAVVDDYTCQPLWFTFPLTKEDLGDTPKIPKQTKKKVFLWVTR
jgi:hypothetical protein